MSLRLDQGRINYRSSKPLIAVNPSAVLASACPRRLMLLDAWPAPACSSTDLDETERRETPGRLSIAVAEEKAKAASPPQVRR